MTKKSFKNRATFSFLFIFFFHFFFLIKTYNIVIITPLLRKIDIHIKNKNNRNKWISLYYSYRMEYNI